MMTARPDGNGWWWVDCDCGYRQGPFLSEADAITDSEEHAEDHE